MNDKMPPKSAEIIVVGSGAGGAVVAKELSEKQHEVLVLEEGGYYTGKDFKRQYCELVPMLFRNSLFIPTLSKPIIPIVMGRVVGGSTVVNEAVCFRIPNYNLELWHYEFGLTDLTEETLQPYFERVESILNVHRVDESVVSKNDLVIKRGAHALGLHPIAYNRNDKDCIGEGQCIFGCPNNAKQAMHVTYLPLAQKAGARLYTYKRVERIIIKDGIGVGVKGYDVDPETFRPIREFMIKAKKVVLSAGAIHTPFILQKSGLKNSDIGRHLHIHPAFRVIGIFDELIEGWKGAECGYYIDDFFRDGIMLSGIFLPPALGAGILPYFGIKHAEIMLQYKNTAIIGTQIADISEGRVRAVPMLSEPIITYKIAKDDFIKIKKAIRIMGEILFSAGAKRIFIPYTGMKEVNDLTSLNRIIEKGVPVSQLELAGFHPMGTARMGLDETISVINSYGKVHGVKNLFVADASIFPSSINVNPQLSIMAFATRTAEYIEISEKF